MATMSSSDSEQIFSLLVYSMGIAAAIHYLLLGNDEVLGTSSHAGCPRVLNVADIYIVLPSYRELIEQVVNSPWM